MGTWIAAILTWLFMAFVSTTGILVMSAAGFSPLILTVAGGFFLFFWSFILTVPMKDAS